MLGKIATLPTRISIETDSSSPFVNKSISGDSLSNPTAVAHMAIHPIPDDYIFFVSAYGNNLTSAEEPYRYVTPHRLDQLRNTIFDEDRVPAYLYIEGGPGSGSVYLYR